MPKINFGLVWALVGMLLLLIEGYTLGLPKSIDTLSYYMRMVRFDKLGRFILLPLWTWLTVHWIIAPKWLGVKPDWRSLVAIGFGLGWAILENTNIIK